MPRFTAPLIAAGIAAAAVALAQTPAPAYDPIVFELVKGSGVDFVTDSGRTPHRHQPETMVAGAALLDYDNDGRLDIFLTNGARMTELDKSEPRYWNRLYHNLGNWKFEDVTEKAGVKGQGYDLGVAVADYDNDGFPDILVLGLRRNTLYHNRGDGTFEDVSEKAGLNKPDPQYGTLWSVDAAFFDYDNDGRLDLFVCSFVDYSGEHKFECGDNKIGKKYYCIPRVFRPTASFLYHNNGDGTFTEVSKGTDIAKALGKGLGVVATDVNGDGRMDLFVANDTVQNFLFLNRGPGTNGRWKWEEVGLQAGVGFSESGQARSGMGVDAADFDQDGRSDLAELVRAATGFAGAPWPAGTDSSFAFSVPSLAWLMLLLAWTSATVVSSCDSRCAISALFAGICTPPRAIVNARNAASLRERVLEI